MVQPGVSPYPDSFKDQVVKEFNIAFAQLGVSISRAANQTAARHGISRTTVIDWAKRRDAMPSPTWGMVYAKDDEIALLHNRINDLTRQISELQAHLKAR